MGMECFQGINEIRVLRTFNILLVVGSASLDALPHAQRVTGEKMSLYLESIVGLCTFNFSLPNFLPAALNTNASADVDAESHALRRDRTSSYS